MAYVILGAQCLSTLVVVWLLICFWAQFMVLDLTFKASYIPWNQDI